MKKIVSSLFVLLGLVPMLSAQVVITQSDFPTAGSVIIRSRDTTLVEFDPGTAGTNNVWSYTVTQNVIDTIQFLSPSATPYASDFPNANLALQIGANVYAYLIVTNSAAEELGLKGDMSPAVPDTVELKYDEPLTFMPFPSQYGTAFNDMARGRVAIPGSVFGVPVDSIILKRTVIRTCNFNASGSLNVNGQFFQDALRFYRVETTVDSIFTKMFGIENFAQEQIDSTKDYDWFVNGYDYPVFTAQVTAAAGDSAISQTFLDPTTSKIKNRQVVVDVYPNPAKEVFYVSGNLTDVKSVKIYNTLGQAQGVTISKNDKGFEVNVQNLSNGVYFYNVLDKQNQKISSGKLIIQR